MDSVAEDPRWKRRLRRIADVAILLELLAIAAFVLTLLVGERSRLTLIALYLPRLPLLVLAVLATFLARFARRRFLLPLQAVVCLVVFFPVMGFNVAASRPSERPIRLATYNVYFGKAGRPQLMDELAAMPVDILLIQAAHSSMGERLKERFPDRTIHQELELILVSRFPLRKAEVPPPLADGTSAMFVKYVVETPSGDLRLYNVHPFSPRHAMFDDRDTLANIAHREQQVAAAVAAARADVPPFIIAGDTNLPGWSSIGRRHLDGLKDAWNEVGLGFGYTFTAKRPWMRIDRALGSDGIRFVDVRVGPGGASDHRPLFVDFELSGDR